MQTMLMLLLTSFLLGCAAPAQFRAPPWAVSPEVSHCDGVSGTYIDRVVETSSSEGAVSFHSLGDLLQTYRERRTNLIMPPYLHTALEWNEPSGGLSVKVSWPQVEQAFRLPAICANGGIEVTTRDVVPIEGFTNNVVHHLRLTRAKNALAIHTTMNVTSTSMGIGVASSTTEVWYRFVQE